MSDVVQPAATTAENTPPARDEKGRFLPQNGAEKRLSVRESIQAALEESKNKAEPPEKPAEPPPLKAAKAEPELPEPEEAVEEEEEPSEQPESEGDIESESPETEEEDERQPQKKPQASKDAPPPSWTKEGRAHWDTLPPAVQREVLKREADSLKGVEKLKENYRDIEEAVAPYKAMIHSMGRTPGAAIKGLFDWQMALAGPNKKQAFRQLAANLGVDLHDLVTDAVAEPSPQAAGAEVPAELKPVLDQYANKITYLDREFSTWKQQAAEQQQAQANQMIEKWAENKPHFASVRELMGQLINSDLAQVQQGRPAIGGFIKNGNIDLDAAYEAAIYAHPEVRNQILAEQAAQKTNEARTKAKIEVKGARKAGVSIKPTAPTAPQSGLPKRQPGRPESVRDSILRAMAEASH